MEAKKTQHTPGPLVVFDGPADKQRDGYKHRWELASVTMLDKGHHPGHVAYVARRADADLLSAAPELLEALERLSEVANYSDKALVAFVREEVAPLARAVIAKARGGK